jgi:hypothetical protein
LADQYYIRLRGRVQGPFDAEKLRQLARRGQFSRLHEVSTTGQQWSSAKDFPELFAPVATPIAAAAQVAGAAQPVTAGAAPSGASPGARPVAGSPQAWYYAYNGQEQGPVDYATLVELVTSRRLTPETEVWCQGMANWAAAHTIPGLVAATSAAPAPSFVPDGAPGKSSAGGEVGVGVIRALAEARPWIIFIAVMGFVYALLLLVGGIFQVIIGSRSAVFPITAGGLTNMALSVVVAFGAWLLISHAGGIAHLERSRREEALRSALATLKSFWVFVGIVLIVLLVLLLLLAILIASMIGSFPDLSGNPFSDL